ncbi:tRNA-modifying protein YgfZ [Synechococcus sp. M16CYN]|uniref:CAF17-like 4Fe-4S cluster assembly/insertion protein YgfZ n=1 Tax=Synechococcus sp. M16CYN TaxID=3103139 RepID=UPI003249DDD1
MSKNLHWDAVFPLLRLEGESACSFLQGQTSANIANALDGALVQSCWLTTTGHLRALLEVRLDRNGADVLVLAGDSSALEQGFSQVIFPTDRVRLRPMSKQRRIQQLLTKSAALWLKPQSSLPRDWTSQPANSQQLEYWRIDQGLAIGPGELKANANPFELGLSDRVDLNKGCYLGQEVVAKLARLGKVKQQLRGWSSGTQLAVRDTMSYNGELAATITSVLNTPHGSIGLALVRRRHLDAEVLDGPSGQPVQLNSLPAFESLPAGC